MKIVRIDHKLASKDISKHLWMAGLDLKVSDLSQLLMEYDVMIVTCDEGVRIFLDSKGHHFRMR